MLQPGGSLVGLLDRAVAQGAEILGISGGDGSIGVAAATAMRHDIPLVVLPGGTRCHFARDLGLDPERIADALRAFEGQEGRIDVGMINDRVFVNNASFGVYADIVVQPGYRENKLESVVAVVERQATEGYALAFEDGGGHARKRAVMVLVGVDRYETMKLFELGSRERLDEGVLQVSAAYHLEQVLLKEMMGIMQFRKHKRSDADFAQWVTETFEIAGPGEQLEVGVDGELVRLKSPVKVRVLPRALRLMVPPEGLKGRKTAARMFETLKEQAAGGRATHE
jgi:diacylglycerol kinase family enzyme